MGVIQLSLLDRSQSRIGVAPRLGLDQRRWLEHEPGQEPAWVDYVARFVEGQDSLFEHLRDTTSWKESRRLMYDRMVDVPRLTATLPKDGPGHAAIDEIREALEARYDRSFDRCGLALYRDGNDSVAAHRDKNVRDRSDCLVALVVLGEPRPFRLRKASAQAGAVRLPSVTLRPGWGDLVVMGGACQDDWEHGVPKVGHAGPRMSLMFRSDRDFA